MPDWKRLPARLLRSAETRNELLRSVRTRASMSFNRCRLQLLRRLKGETLWTRRGGYWLPFHGDDDKQELLYQLHGDFWFEYESERLRPWLPKDGVIIDVGANLGFMSLLFAKHVGPGGQIYAFEPSSLVYPKLIEVLEKNKVRNVQCFKLGCGAKREVQTLLVPESSGNATIKRSGVEVEGFQQEVSSKIDTLDNIVAPLASRVDFLKIDTEGFEDQVLAGARELVERHRPIIYIELSQEFGDSSARAIAWLKDRRYTFEREPDLESARNGDNFLVFPNSR